MLNYNLSQTVNNQTAQIHANSAGILQNAAQSASNFGAFYGMGDDGDGSNILLRSPPPANSSTTPNPSDGDSSSTTSSTTSNKDNGNNVSISPSDQISITAQFRKILKIVMLILVVIIPVGSKFKLFRMKFSTK